MTQFYQQLEDYLLDWSNPEKAYSLIEQNQYCCWLLPAHAKSDRTLHEKLVANFMHTLRTGENRDDRIYRFTAFNSWDESQERMRDIYDMQPTPEELANFYQLSFDRRYVGAFTRNLSKPYIKKLIGVGVDYMDVRFYDIFNGVALRQQEMKGSEKLTFQDWQDMLNEHFKNSTNLSYLPNGQLIDNLGALLKEYPDNEKNQFINQVLQEFKGMGASEDNHHVSLLKFRKHEIVSDYHVREEKDLDILFRYWKENMTQYQSELGFTDIVWVKNDNLGIYEIFIESVNEEPVKKELFRNIFKDILRMYGDVAQYNNATDIMDFQEELGRFPSYFKDLYLFYTLEQTLDKNKRSIKKLKV